MKEKDLNSALRNAAIKNGLCEQWQKEWEEDWDSDKMVSQFFRGIDFYIKNRFISNTFFKEWFGDKFLRDNGILVDDKYSLLNPEQAILIGKSSSTIRFNRYTASTVYLVDDAMAKVSAKDNSFVIVHVYDRAQVEVEQQGKAKVVAIVHSKQCLVISGDDITIKEEINFLA